MRSNVPGLLAAGDAARSRAGRHSPTRSAAVDGDSDRRAPAGLIAAADAPVRRPRTADTADRVARRPGREDPAAAGWRATGARSASRSSAPAAASRPTSMLIDAVAPSTSPAWFLRQFRCGGRRSATPEADELLDAARGGDRRRPAQRSARRGGATDGRAAACSSRIAAPIRWSLVSDRVAGFRNEPLRAGIR